MIFTFFRQAGADDNPIFNWIFDLFGNLFPDTHLYKHPLIDISSFPFLKRKFLTFSDGAKKRRSIRYLLFCFEYPQKRGGFYGFERWGCIDYFYETGVNQGGFASSELLITSHTHYCIGVSRRSFRLFPRLGDFSIFSRFSIPYTGVLVFRHRHYEAATSVT